MDDQIDSQGWIQILDQNRVNKAHLLEELSEQMSDIERQFPMFDTFNMENASDEQRVRQALYRLRCDLGNIQEWYATVKNDKEVIK